MRFWILATRWHCPLKAKMRFIPVMKLSWSIWRLWRHPRCSWPLLYAGGNCFSLEDDLPPGKAEDTPAVDLQIDRDKNYNWFGHNTISFLKFKVKRKTGIRNSDQIKKIENKWSDKWSTVPAVTVLSWNADVWASLGFRASARSNPLTSWGEKKT